MTWYIASADTSTILTAYEAADNISGLHVSGGNTDTLSLSGIPSWMNGCQVQACFTGEGGPVYTDVAKIWTYEECVRESNPCWCPVVYEWSYYEPVAGRDPVVPWWNPPHSWEYQETPPWAKKVVVSPWENCPAPPPLPPCGT